MRITEKKREPRLKKLRNGVQYEDISSVTGPHIAGTGDDSDTVVVRKKKKEKTIYGILRRARQK